MKRIIFTVLATVFVGLVYGQSTYITTEGAIIIQTSTEELQDKSETYSSMFVINSDVTRVRHSIDGMTSTYYIRDREFKTNNKGQKLLYLYVVSDVGNKYIMVCNKDEKLWFTINPAGDYTWIYAIKGVWQE